jgi:hypothetical protein
MNNSQQRRDAYKNWLVNCDGKTSNVASTYVSYLNKCSALVRCLKSFLDLDVADDFDFFDLSDKDTVHRLYAKLNTKLPPIVEFSSLSCYVDFLGGENKKSGSVEKTSDEYKEYLIKGGIGKNSANSYVSYLNTCSALVRCLKSSLDLDVADDFDFFNLSDKAKVLLLYAKLNTKLPPIVSLTSLQYYVKFLGGETIQVGKTQQYYVQPYKKWLVKYDGKTPNVANSYTSGVNTCSKIADFYFFNSGDLDEVKQQFESLMRTPSFIANDKARNKTPSNALKRYIEFLEFIKDSDHAQELLG